jgi:hypothetical protein
LISAPLFLSAFWGDFLLLAGSAIPEFYLV